MSVTVTGVDYEARVYTHKGVDIFFFNDDSLLFMVDVCVKIFLRSDCYKLELWNVKQQRLVRKWQ